MFKTINGGKLPTKGSKYSAAVDVYANEDVAIRAGDTKLIGLGITIDINIIHETMAKNGYFGYCPIGSEPEFEEQATERLNNFLSTHYLQLMLRSSLGTKGLILPNGVGIIDLDFPDELKMIVHNPIKLIGYNREEDMIYQYGMSHLSDFGMGQEYNIKKGDRIGQLILLEHQSYLFGIDTKDERTGGFGSTGIK